MSVAIFLVTSPVVWLFSVVQVHREDVPLPTDDEAMYQFVALVWLSGVGAGLLFALWLWGAP